MFSLGNKPITKLMSEAQSGMMYSTQASCIEQKDMERVFARLFSTENGQKVLAYLQVVTFQRALGATAPDEHLRYMEGQRAMVATILRLIDRGRQG